MKSSSFLKYLLLPVIIFSIFFNYYKAVMPSIPIGYWDEHYWIGGGYFLDLFIKGDFINSEWQEHLSYDQPMLAKYLYGLVLYPHYLKEKATHQNIKYDYAMFLIDNNFFEVGSKYYQDYKKTKKYFVNWGPKDTNIKSEHLLNKYGINFQKTIDLILKARKINVLLLSSTVLIVYYIALFIANIPIALITCFLFGFNSLIIRCGLVAHSDSLFIFFFNLSLLFFLLLITSKKINYKYSVLFAISVMLTTQTKINGIMLLLFYTFFTLILLGLTYYKHQVVRIKKLIIQMLLVYVIFFVSFCISNPYLYKSPFTNFIKLFMWRREVAFDQSIKLGSYLPTFFLRINAIYSHFLSINCNNFSNIFFLDGIGQCTIFPLIGTISFYIGIAYSIIKILTTKTFFTRFNRLQTICIIFILTQLIMGFYLFLDWDRYYIHLVFFFCFFIAIGLFFILRLLKIIGNEILSNTFSLLLHRYRV